MDKPKTIAVSCAANDLGGCYVAALDSNGEVWLWVQGGINWERLPDVPHFMPIATQSAIVDGTGAQHGG